MLEKSPPTSINSCGPIAVEIIKVYCETVENIVKAVCEPGTDHSTTSCGDLISCGYHLSEIDSSREAMEVENGHKTDGDTSRFHPCEGGCPISDNAYHACHGVESAFRG